MATSRLLPSGLFRCRELQQPHGCSDARSQRLLSPIKDHSPTTREPKGSETLSTMLRADDQDERELSIHSNLILESIEVQINREIRQMFVSKLRLCQLLGSVVRSQAYKQLGFSDFKSYLRAGRLSLNYKTALRYARLGNVFARYEEDIRAVHFDDGSGILKLEYLETALQNHPGERPRVFKLMQDASFRSFRDFALARRPVEAKLQSSPSIADYRPIDIISIRTEDDTILCRCKGAEYGELIWFNPAFFTDPRDYWLFKRSTVAFVKDYLSSHRASNKRSG